MKLNSEVIYSDEFITKLQKQNLWSYKYTFRVINEYVKFIHLGLKQEVSPSYEIDQVWHMHILYTKDYHNMCKSLGIDYFHHNPIDKKIPNSKDNYSETLELYKSTFQTNPPLDIWTKWKPTNYVFIDLKQHWVTPVNDWKALLKILFKFINSEFIKLIDKGFEIYYKK